MLFGLLAGAVIGQQGGAEAPQRVFTVRFDPEQEQWRAYDGALVGDEGSTRASRCSG
jgi:hypothetical protein